MDVQLGERRASYAAQQHAALGGRLGADVDGRQQRGGGLVALWSPRAWTIASGRSGPTWAPIGAMSLSPTP